VNHRLYPPFCVGACFIVGAKHLIPHVKFVQERENLYSDAEDQVAAENVFLQGVESTGIARRSLIKRTLGLALGLLPLPILFSLRDPRIHSTIVGMTEVAHIGETVDAANATVPDALWHELDSLIADYNAAHAPFSDHRDQLPEGH